MAFTRLRRYYKRYYEQLTVTVGGIRFHIGLSQPAHLNTRYFLQVKASNSLV